jgi:hypothetical protein
MRCRVLTACVLLALAGGCGGGDDGPSLEEQLAARERWAERADEVCKKAEQDIIARGAPIDILDIDRVAVRGAADVREAIAAIRRLRTPPGSAGLVRPVLAELDRLEEHLGALTRASERADMDGLLETAQLLEGDTSRLSERGYKAGLRDCADADVPVIVSDAIVAPVFATKVAAFDRWFQRSLTRITRRLPKTPRQAADYYARVNAQVAKAAERWDRLRPPWRARSAAEAYDDALADVQRVSGDIAAALDGGRRITPAWARRVERTYTRLGRRERKAMRRVLRDTGARPLGVPPPQRRPTPPTTEETA